MRIANVNTNMCIFPMEDEVDKYLEMIEHLLEQGYTAITFTDIPDEEPYRG